MEYIFEWTFLGLDSIIVAICLHNFLKCKSHVTAVREVPVYDISDQLENLVYNRWNLKIPYVAIRGTVKAIGSPLKSLSPSQISSVVQRFTLREHAITHSASGHWATKERLIHDVYNYVPFVLYSKTTKVEILDPLAADILHLEVAADWFVPISSNVMGLVEGFVNGVATLRGVQATEGILREGGMATAIGELVVSNTSETRLKLREPSSGAPFCVTAFPIEFILEKLEEKKRFYLYLTLTFSFVGVIIAGYILYRWSEDQRRRGNENETRG